MLGVSTLQRISKLIWWITSSKIVDYSIDYGSIGINQRSMQNTFELLSHMTYTRSVKRLGLKVNGKFNTQLTSGHLEMCCPNKFWNTHRFIDYSLVTRKWKPPWCRQKGSAGELQVSYNVLTMLHILFLMQHRINPALDLDQWDCVDIWHILSDM